MRAVLTDLSADPSEGGASGLRHILVVDDSRAQRRAVAASLSRQGYLVCEAGSGEEALALLAEGEIDMVLSDWMMPGMDGLDLCAQVRAQTRDYYVYFILLTAKSEKGAVAQGLDRGADDFLTKPVNAQELRARINAGERLLSLERELIEKNRLISSTLAQISALYDALDQDLIEARKMQQALMRDRDRDFGAARVSLMHKPCGHVGGDLVGFFAAGAGRVAAYSIDVSGHGIASALLTARIAGYLSDGSPEQNIALYRDASGALNAFEPAEVARRLNRLLLNGVQSDLYFTMVLAYLDLASGTVEAVQCGHPNPAILRRNGEVEFIGRGGLPIGLVEGATYEGWTFDLAPADRLILYSDGFTECTDADGLELEEPGLAVFLARSAALPSPALLEVLTWDLDGFRGADSFDDDLSCALMEFRGLSRPAG